MAVENAGPVILTVHYPPHVVLQRALRSRSRLPRVFVPDHNQTGRLDMKNAENNVCQEFCPIVLD